MVFFFFDWAGGGNLLFQQKSARFTIAGAYILNPHPTHFNHFPPRECRKVLIRGGLVSSKALSHQLKFRLRSSSLRSSVITSAILWLYWLLGTLLFNSSSISLFGPKFLSPGHQNLGQHVKICSASSSSST